MMSSRLELQKPELLNTGKIRSWFSLKNSGYRHPDALIPGLNLGLNSREEQAVVQAHLQELLSAISTGSEDFAFAKQIHESTILKVDKGGLYENVDGFITTTPGIALAIQVADCAAILLGDPVNNVVAAVHAGWRGAVGNIVPKAIQKMKDQGADVSMIRAFISPCLSVQNFEVGEEVAVQFPDRFVDRTNYEKPHVDLKAFIKHQMLVNGLSEDHIECDDSCTIDGEDQYYSYRREGQESGRMMGVIKLEAAE